jgi:hypothetical protein
MPTAAPPPPPPAPVAYPPPPPPSTTNGAPPPSGPAHKLSTGQIGLIGGGAAAAIGGVVALVVLLGGGDKSDPPTPKPTPVATQTPSIPGDSTGPGSQPSAEPSSAPTQPTDGGDTGGTTGSAIDLGNGVTLTPAAGWTAQDIGSSNQALLINSDSTVSFFVGVGQADNTDPVSVLSTDINSEVQGGALTDVQLGDTQSGTLNGSVFDAVALVPFSATQSSQQGTDEIVGRFAELINTQSANSAFIVVKALSSDAIDASTEDVTAMTFGMAGAS